MDLRGAWRGRARPIAAGAAAIVLLAGGGILWDLVIDAPPGVTAQNERIEVVDGPKDDQKVTLDATFFKPVGRKRAPAILLAHGFGGSKNESRAEAEDLARAGYSVLTWSARGFGRSTGQIALNSPDYEVKDVRQLIDWLARRPEVEKVGGDPRVGITGGSYGGAIALLTAAYDRRVDAIAPRITWNDLADALFPNARTGGTADSGVFKKLWAGIFFTAGDPAAGGFGNGGTAGTAGPPGSGAPRAAQATACGRFLPALCEMYERVAESGQASRAAVETLRRSSPAAVADRIKAPTLLVQGQSDSLFPLDQADANAAAIKRNGAPVSVVWYQGGHDGGDDETGRLRGLVRDWFDRWLKDEGDPPPAFTVTRAGGLDSSTQEVVVEAATARAYPGLRNEPRLIRLAGAEQTVRNPAGGSPASVSAVPGLGALGGLGTLAGTGAAGAIPLDMPGQAAAFDSAPLGAPLRLTGAPRVRIKVSGDRAATLFAKLYDVGPQGAGPARRLAAPLRVEKAPGGREVEVTLPAMDYRFDRGHRLRLVLATTDMGFATPAAPAAYKVTVTSGLTVPTVPALRAPAAPLPGWVWVLPVAAAGVAAAIALAGRRRRSRGRPTSYDPALATVPLEITGLTKAYRNGQLAVDDLSVRVEKGQVLGLLGPNGAGKTTTLRMLMGLIHPDAGEIRIFGHRVTPGAPVLSRLGSFVEGPGFLPHLSGRDNLDLYWRATGRPPGESHADEALAIAGLGAALDRPVRTYSHGMRQRLAIAQAMLGLPDLLVLDEPTNGLDPPQIREMREVLVGYAAGGSSGGAGRTVIISSHMLAEVEQTCTHVVVMFQGRRVAAGPVAEIAGPQRRLEDAFLEIIGEGTAQ